MKLIGFDMFETFIPEYLHSICLGVVRYLLILWMSPKSRKQLWFLSKKKIAIIDKRLSQTKPPYDITRTPSSLLKILHWKASEFRSFLLYYSTVLEGVLPDPFYSHFRNLSYGMNIMLQQSVETEYVEKAGVLFTDFIWQTELLYGKEYVAFNFHLLDHFKKCCLDWGCFWANSTFIPEWFNGQLQRSVNGTQAVIEQMASHFLMLNAVRNEATSMIKAKPVSKVSDLLRKMLQLPKSYEYGFKKSVTIQKNLNLLGKPVSRSLNLEQQEAIEKVLFKTKTMPDDGFKVACALEEKVDLFPRMSHSYGTIFTTTSYTRSCKRINYCALLSDGRFIFIDHFVHLKSAPEYLNLFILGRVLGSEGIETLCPTPIRDTTFKNLPGQTSKFIGIYESMEAFLPCHIFKKCVVASYNTLVPSIVATALANQFETD